MNQSHRNKASSASVRVRTAATTTVAAIFLALLGTGTAAADERTVEPPAPAVSCCATHIGTAIGFVEDLYEQVVLGLDEVHDWG